MRSVLIWSILALYLGSPVTPAQANDAEECNKASTSPDAAIEACSRLIALRPISPFAGKRLAVVYSNRCLAYYFKAEFDDAIGDCNEAISLDSGLAAAYNNRGLISIKLGEFDKAIDDLTAAVQFNPTYAVAWANRCLAYLNKPDTNRAIADCDQAISLNPNLAVAYIQRGVLWRMKGDFERSLSDYNSAIRLDPGQVLAFTVRCSTLRAKNENDRALNDCNEAIRLNSKFALAYNYRGLVWDAKGETDRALSDYNSAIRLDPNPISALKNRGSLYERLRQLESARADYEAAMNLTPRTLESKQAQELVRARLKALTGPSPSPPQTAVDRRDAQAAGTVSRPGMPANPSAVASLEPSTTQRTSSVPTPVTLIPLRREGGIFSVPVTINGKIILNFLLDSGAADVSIPADVVLTLKRTGTLGAADFLEKKTYKQADGSELPSQTFLIKSLQIGNKIVENVTGSVGSVKGDLLLGQSFLSRFKSWSIDNQRQVLVLE
jgi:clan AA aspartic protease (TIGR02281 family)